MPPKSNVSKKTASKSLRMRHSIQSKMRQKRTSRADGVDALQKTALSAAPAALNAVAAPAAPAAPAPLRLATIATSTQMTVTTPAGTEVSFVTPSAVQNNDRNETLYADLTVNALPTYAYPLPGTVCPALSVVRYEYDGVGTTYTASVGVAHEHISTGNEYATMQTSGICNIQKDEHTDESLHSIDTPEIGWSRCLIQPIRPTRALLSFA
jgi:hypothetical protein